MSFLFSIPAALFGLAGVGVLIGIYLFRNRFRLHTVSSLMLWEDHKKPRQGGIRLSRIQTPLLFLLELLAILLLVLAAAGPLIRRQEQRASHVIILDDSVSMQAGETVTSRQAAQEAVLKLLEEAGVFRARFILAGVSPRLLGEPVGSTAEVERLLANWTCQSPAADIDEAILLGTELAGQTERLLVVTDHAPAEPLTSTGKLEWRAFGSPRANAAFTEAGYGSDGRCFLAVANLFDRPAEASWRIETADGSEQLYQQTLRLEPRQTQRVFLDMKGSPDIVRARLETDALEADNDVLLVREQARAILLDVRIEDETLDQAVRRAVEASGLAALNSPQPHLLLTDQTPASPDNGECWQALFTAEPNAVSYMGPFLVDRSHPLTEGLALDGVIWGAGQMPAGSGPAVIAAGSVPLVHTQESPNGSRQIRINFIPRLSTLLQSPNWPVLIWNLLQWRQSYLPGLDRPNFALGQTVSFVPSLNAQQAPVLIDPHGAERPVPPFSGLVQVLPEEAGLYRIRDEQKEYPFAINLLSASESDLSRAQTGRWGRWQEASLFRWEYQALDWLLLLGALAVLVLHRWVHVKTGVDS